MSAQVQEFTYSVVGTKNPVATHGDEDGSNELVNCYGCCTGACQEYARRYAVQLFKENFPNGTIIMAAAAPIRRESLRRVTIKP